MKRHIAIVGLNHTTAPVEVREKFHFTRAALRDALERAKNLAEAEEIAIISTCNRVEIVSALKERGAHRKLEEFLSDCCAGSSDLLKEHSYHFFDLEAVRHLFRVCASLDSMVVGEAQVLGQVKDAFEEAVRAGALRGLLFKCFEKAFHSAKRVRTETAVSDGAVSVGYAAVELAKKIFSDLSRQKVLVIGAGEMAEATTEHLAKSGGASVIVSNRNYDKAVELALRFGGSALRFDALDNSLKDADIVISSTAYPGYIITKEKMAEALKIRKQKPVFLIDIALPRDIDPQVNALEGVFLYNIDDLEGVIKENLAWRTEEARRAETIIDDEVKKFSAYLDTAEVDPILGSLSEKLEKIRKGELEKAKKHLSPIKPEDAETLERMTQSIVQKIISNPSVVLKDNAKKGRGHDLADALKRLFDI